MSTYDGYFLPYKIPSSARGDEGNGPVCFGTNATSDKREERRCVAVKAAPLVLQATGQIIVVSTATIGAISAATPSMPPVTWEALGARFGIIVLGTGALMVALIGLSSSHPKGYVFLLGLRLDAVLASIATIATLYSLSIYDVLTYLAGPRASRKREMKAKAAREAGEDPPQPPSLFYLSLLNTAPASFVIIIFLLYGTAVPIAFEAAETEFQKIAVYFAALACFKTGGDILLKRLFRRLGGLSLLAMKSGLFAFELVTSTQTRLLLASYPETRTVLAVSTATAVWEICTRMMS